MEHYRWKIALHFSGSKHAGENLAEVLKRRPPGLAPLIQMYFHGPLTRQ
jgi:hypothetical protein